VRRWPSPCAFGTIGRAFFRLINQAVDETSPPVTTLVHDDGCGWQRIPVLDDLPTRHAEDVDRDGVIGFVLYCPDKILIGDWSARRLWRSHLPGGSDPISWRRPVVPLGVGVVLEVTRVEELVEQFDLAVVEQPG